MRAFVFPGQGAQFAGMGKDLYDENQEAKRYFEWANEILGFDITKIMFEGSDDELKQTKVTQPAIFLHSVINALTKEGFNPEMVAGHSLGEFSALTAVGALKFEDGVQLVSKRAQAMQKACEVQESTMAAVLGLEDNIVEEICKNASGIVVPANYNCPGQLVISGDVKAIEETCNKLKDAGARRALVLPVGGAFHSPLMEPARKELAEAIEKTTFIEPICTIYQNVDAEGHKDINEIKENLVKQLVSPVKWTQSVRQMIEDGATHFIESGPGKVLQGLVMKIDRSIEVSSL